MKLIAFSSIDYQIISQSAYQCSGYELRNIIIYSSEKSKNDGRNTSLDLSIKYNLGILVISFILFE